MYVPQSQAGKVERKTMVSPLLRAGLWEEGEHSWGKDPRGCLDIQVGEEQTVLLSAPWLGLCSHDPPKSSWAEFYGEQHISCPWETLARQGSHQGAPR